MERPENVLRDAQALGLKLYVKDGELRGTPASVATPELRDRIKATKPQLISLLLHFAKHPTPSRSGPPKPTGPPLDPNEFGRRLGRAPRSTSELFDSREDPA